MEDRLAWTVILTLIIITIRWGVSLNPYSGAGKSPMYGDYEAQRHWMEITTNLPIDQWYSNSSDNDFLYWGLDYPPLTAYHSWLCGIISSRFDPEWTALNTSRGYESYEHKLFMRYSVIVVDILLYVPAVFAFFSSVLPQSSSPSQLRSAFTVLLYPGLILIDHGHFQYNSASLGFALWAMVALATNHDLLGSVAFVLALNYKQMELYHAVPFFCCLLSRCLCDWKRLWIVRLWKLFQVGVVVLATFALCWLPFLTDATLAVKVLGRLFPFDRGVFEDKVSNFWCSLNIAVKIKNHLSQDALVKICLAATGAFLIPLSVDLLRAGPKSVGSTAKFHYALVNSSLIFFLFSYQVHEKSILLAALPVCCLFDRIPVLCTWFLLISTFSMLPLIIKDGLFLPYVALCVMFTVVARMSFPEKSPRIQPLFCLSLFGAAVLSVASVAVQPPARFPDLFAVLISVYSCVHFIGFLVAFSVLQFTEPISGTKRAVATKQKGQSSNRVEIQQQGTVKKVRSRKKKQTSQLE